MTKASRLLAVLAACASLAACEQGTTGPSAEVLERARSVAHLDIASQMPARLLAGMTVPVAFRALDANNQPVAGVHVQFNTGQSPASTVREADAVTDSAGMARTDWTLGTVAGEYELSATVVYGKASRNYGLSIAEGIADPPRFIQRAVTLDGPICGGELQISGSRMGAISNYIVNNPEVLRGATVESRSGFRSWMYVGFYAVAPGVATVVVNDAYGRSDTATVTVGNAVPVVSLPDTLRVAVGDSALVLPTIYGPCAGWLYRYMSPTFYSDTVRFRATSLAPDVFRAEQRLPGTFRPTIIGLKPGTGKVVTTFWGGVDTAAVVVR